ncbi:MAG TPA: methylmalonyl Co-A mutase-associated GTPase MeaB [Jatrophihabitans sp.]|nr:methylmalonyl Co-A mutase-associated GTPase MeaB [Jatrophihabitans sp.]
MTAGRLGADRADLAALVQQAADGQARAVARLISLIESGAPELPELAQLLAPLTGRAQVVGLTGPPGVGKSSSTSALIGVLRAAGAKVGVLAVDPSSPLSGGALLGDRIRMTEHATDPGVFVRSMATRGQLGGLAAAVPQALRVLDAAGCDVVLLETVGVGQSEVEVVRLADTTVVLLAPGMGDSVQAAKAGILEIADIFVINKADTADAGTVSGQLRQVRSMAGARPGWEAPILHTVATRGDGIAELVAAIEQHRGWLTSSGELARRRNDRARGEIEAIALAAVRRRFAAVTGAPALTGLADRVAAGDLDAYAAADTLLASLPGLLPDRSGRDDPKDRKARGDRQ